MSDSATQDANNEATESAAAGGPETTAPRGPTPEEIAARMDRLEQQGQRQQAYDQLATDPDIAAVIAAKQQGKKIKVVDDVPPPEEPEEEPDWDNLSPKEISALVEKRAIKRAGKIVAEQMAPVTQRLQRVDQYVADQQTQALNAEVARVHKKYPDLPKYAAQMQQISSRNPDLDIEELYLKARARSGQPLKQPPPATDMATERPSHSAARPSVGTAEAQEEGVGRSESQRARFQRKLDAALDRVKAPTLS